MPAENGTRSGWLGGLADQAENFLRVRTDRLVAAARQETEQLAERAGERFAVALVEQLSRRLAARIAGAAAVVGSVVIAVWLLAVGLAGALGELMDSTWLGQIVAGALTLLAVGICISISRVQSQARLERDPH